VFAKRETDKVEKRIFRALESWFLECFSRESPVFCLKLTPMVGPSAEVVPTREG
jgi:hypothetical protein